MWGKLLWYLIYEIQLKKQQKKEKVANKRDRKEKKLLENGWLLYIELVSKSVIFYIHLMPEGEEDIEKILKDLAEKEKQKTGAMAILS